MREDDRDRIEAVLGCSLVDWKKVVGGYTAAERWLCTTVHGSVFAKIGVTPRTAGHLAREYRSYQRIAAPFMPALLGYAADDDRPILLLEDLSNAIWPTDWTPRRVETVLACIDQMHRTRPAEPLNDFSEDHEELTRGWAQVSADPLSFLSLGLENQDWLRRALPALIESEAACRFDGDALCHWDLRSDNMCLTGDGVKLIDWADACMSNPKADLAAWLPSLAHEGGPLPDDILPGEPEIAAWVSGYFAARAGLAPVPDAPRVRAIQLAQLRTALPWCRRALRV